MKKVEIADEIYEKIEKRMNEFGFKTVEEYVDFVLRQSLSDEKDENVFSEEEEEAIKKRLRDLGYLD